MIALAWPHYLQMGALVLAGACLQGVGGLGFSMFCAPLAALWFPELLPAPVLLLGCPLAALAAWRERQAIEWKVAGLALGGRGVGAALAAYVLQRLSVNLVSVLFALLILCGVALSLAGRRPAQRPRTFVAAGLASGLMATITTAGAPPLALAMQHCTPAALRATLGCIFFLGSLMSIAALASVGKAHVPDLLLGALLLPWLLAGFALSAPISRRLSPALIRHFMLALASLGALTLLLQTLPQLL